MQENLINNYIAKMTINDVYSFASKQGINLNDNEASIIYNKIKNNYKTIIYGDASNIFNDVKGKISDNTYIKMEQLYRTFKEKYRDYL